MFATRVPSFNSEFFLPDSSAFYWDANEPLVLSDPDQKINEFLRGNRLSTDFQDFGFNQLYFPVTNSTTNTVPVRIAPNSLPYSQIPVKTETVAHLSAPFDDSIKSKKRDRSPSSSSSSDEDTSSAKKRTRFVWSAELHEAFEDALSALGPSATAKSVMNYMKAKGTDISPLTRVRVSNHMQHYRSRCNQLLVSSLQNKK
eukprot:TRINITY_DN3110_c0_g1_i1.p1 TRINITY_DN3110_c0_g1~~TRINITY_DN3110_c0_g1_i1.p1  ORF type:complete len:200 (-),score=57.94 TRINITY_DN3110_c0_g1_i1:23-622(-)